MDHRRADWSRRAFVGGLTLGWTAGLLGLDSGQAAAEPPPETTKLRLPQIPGICVAPQYVAEALMISEGFIDVQYVKLEGDLRALASGEIDIAMAFVAPFIMQVDAGDPIVLLAGVHTGCFELFGTNQVRAIRDLKGKTVAVWFQGSFQQIFQYRSTCGHRPAERHQLGHTSIRGSDAPLSRRQDRRVPGLSTRAPGAPGTEDRARGRQQRAGPTLVPVLLLHGGRQP